MRITEVKKKNGTTVYRASVYLGVDQVTGKKVKTSVTGRTRKEVKSKAQQAQIDFKVQPFKRQSRSRIFKSWLIYG